MKKVSILLVIFLLAAINLSVLAQEEEEEKDILELAFYGGMGVPSGGLTDWHDSLGAKSGWSVGGDIGYFIKTNIVAGFNFSYTQFGVDTDGPASALHHRLYNPNLYLKYYFEGESNLVPYVKAHVGIENPKFATLVGTATGTTAGNRYREKSYNPSFAYGIGAGIYYYTAFYSGLYLEVNYHRAASKSSTANYGGVDYEFGEDIGVIDIHAGIRLLISKN